MEFLIFIIKLVVLQKFLKSFSEVFEIVMVLIQLGRNRSIYSLRT